MFPFDVPLGSMELRFARDRDRVLGSRALRRLAGKTQVVALPGEPLLRSRLSHTLEVSSMARELARRLGLVEPLAEAIALAHDFGHPAFGHAGERALAALVPGGFHHAAHGVRVVTHLEPLGLCPEVVDGILKHSKGKGGAILARGRALAQSTREGLVVRAADLFAYACHDLDDAFLLGSLRKADVPRNVARVLGDAPSEIRGALVGTTVRYSVDHGDLALAPETAAALLSLRSFLYERLYEGPRIAAQTARVRSLFESVWEAFCERPRQWARVVSAGRWATALPIEPRDEVSAEAAAPSIDGFPDVMAVSFFVDTIAAMTDRQVLRLGRDLKVPRRVRSWPEGFAV